MGDISRSHNSKHHLWSKMKLGTALLLLSIFYLTLANVNAEDDSEQDLTSDNHVGANQIADTNNQAEHQLVKRDAGRGRKASCEGTRCGKKKTPKKGKKGQKPKKSEKKKKKESTKKTPKKKTKKRKSGKKSPKEKRRGGSRRRGEGSSRTSTDGRQITGNATSCAMKLVLYARLNEKKASSISKQVTRIIGNEKGKKGKKGKREEEMKRKREKEKKRKKREKEKKRKGEKE